MHSGAVHLIGIRSWHDENMDYSCILMEVILLMKSDYNKIILWLVHLISNKDIDIIS